MSVNKVMAMGRIGKIESKALPNGTAVVNLSIACSEKWKDKQGQSQEKTEWINAVSFGKQAEIIGQYFNKGDGIFIIGKLTTRKWQDQSGQDRYTTEVHINEFDFPVGKSGDQPKQQSNGFDDKPKNTPVFDNDFEEDSIPF